MHWFKWWATLVMEVLLRVGFLWRPISNVHSLQCYGADIECNVPYFCRAPNYFESWVLTTFALLRHVMLTLPPAVPSDDGEHDTCASVQTEVRLQSLLVACIAWLSIKERSTNAKAWVANPSSGTFCRLGSKRRKQGIASGQCSHCLLCLSFRSTMPSLPVLLVNMVVLPVQRKPV